MRETRTSSGTQVWILIHHTNCGMRGITEEVVRDVLGAEMDWMPLGEEVQSVQDDVETIRQHPLVPNSVEIHGCLYGVHTGNLRRVV